jgi:hypothetical protein
MIMHTKRILVRTVSPLEYNSFYVAQMRMFNSRLKQDTTAHMFMYYYPANFFDVSQSCCYATCS